MNLDSTGSVQLGMMTDGLKVSELVTTMQMLTWILATKAAYSYTYIYTTTISIKTVLTPEQ